MSDPFNCPKCGAHDYGLFAAALQDCPHCQRAEIERLRRELAEARRLLRDILYWYWNANSTAMAVETLDRIDAALASDQPDAAA
jgi:hypothetical protein